MNLEMVFICHVPMPNNEYTACSIGYGVRKGIYISPLCLSKSVLSPKYHIHMYTQCLWCELLNKSLNFVMMLD